MQEWIPREAEELLPRLVEWRRDFHRHPELGFQEVRTAGIVAAHLQELGLEVTTGVGRTGVIAMVEPDDLPDDGETVLLRFDMDALPIREETGLPFASQNAGVMHACGHDGHTAIGMGVAELLTKHRNELPGRVKLVFQPAEEGLGGAMAMINDGALEAPQPAAAYGLPSLEPASPTTRSSFSPDTSGPPPICLPLPSTAKAAMALHRTTPSTQHSLLVSLSSRCRAS